MKRRHFITFVGGAGAWWPLAARAQQPAMPVIGFLSGRSMDPSILGAFHRGLAETGYVAGKNAAIEYRSTEGQINRMPAMAADLVRRQVAVIAAAGTPAALAAKAATSIIPIVFETAGDPITLGLVTSLNRPGRNVTGVAQLSSELVPKRLGLVHDLIPTATIIGLLVNPNDPRAGTQARDVQEAAQGLGLQIHLLNAGTDAEIDAAFAGLVQLGVGALIVGTSEFFSSRREKIAALATEHKVPAIYQYREYVAVGGLLSYGASLTDSYRLAGNYCGQILKGEKAADLPVQQAVRFELVINLKTAKALGLSIPPGLLAIADEVIE